MSEEIDKRYEETRSAKDRDKCIQVSRLVVLTELGIGGSDVAFKISNLCDVLEDRFVASQRLPDTDEAILWRRTIVNMDPERSSEFWYSDANNFSRALLDRYKVSREPRDLESSNKWAINAKEAISTDDENYHVIAYQLAVTYQYKWERYEDLESLEEEIRWYRESVRFLDDDSPYIRHRENLLGVALCIRADNLRSVNDMEESLPYLTRTRERCAEGSEEFIRAVNNLSNAYETAADIDGLDTDDAIKNALECAKAAVKCAPLNTKIWIFATTTYRT